MMKELDAHTLGIDEQLITDEQTEKLCIALIKGTEIHLKRKAAEYEFTQIFKWAGNILADKKILDSVFSGNLLIALSEDNEVHLLLNPDYEEEPPNDLSKDRPETED